jgi:hypothetical protein
VHIDLQDKLISHLTQTTLLEMKVDHFCSSYAEVKHAGAQLAKMFFTNSAQDILVVNLKQEERQNNFGFNLCNFVPKLIDSHFAEIVEDYERSFVGAFSHAIFELDPKASYEFSVSKFRQDTGYNLTSKQSVTGNAIRISEESVVSSDNATKIPEFVKIRKTLDLYRYLTETNLKNDQIGNQPPLDNELAMMQFKSKSNSITFLNLPLHKKSDKNVACLLEILNSDPHQYLPYNRSIVTRILYPALASRQWMLVGHFCKSAFGSFGF